jgi:hypothetical protein
MRLPMTIAVVTATAILAAVLAGVLIAARSAKRRQRHLRRAALVLNLIVAVALAPYTVADSGAAAGFLLGVPVLAATVPVIADLTGTARLAADAVGAVATIGWALLLALGIGTAFLPGGLLLVIVLAIDLTSRELSST